MKDQKTLRLLLPQWQGGNNPNYYFGGELLAQIVPASAKDKLRRVPVAKDFDKALAVEDGVKGSKVLLQQLADTTKILEEENPDRVIVLGGDCSISQAPFDYLNGKYGGNLGILWLDAHPDVALAADTTHDHEMVLGNLLGGGAPSFAEKVQHPVKPSHVMFAGLIYEELRPRDQAVNRMQLRYATPQQLKENSQPIIDWLKENNIQQVAVHFDLDVLTPEDFRSIYPAEPYLKTFDAAIGEMTLKEVTRVLTDLSKETELVGLSIAEHMPWDALNLRRALSQVSIFK
ncbi:arginase family protein [Enterococcus devriesei]|uniref:arginase family protein n=1 Tax=Enterococcus devriesei TaxID=319970 RepID=UPI0036D25B87